jgi:hypothetical protein
MAADASWYEAAFVVGVTNAVNVVADALSVASLKPVDDPGGDATLATLFDDIRAFYARPDVPVPFRVIAHDPGYAADLWGAVRRAFTDNVLGRRLKESLAFAVSLTTHSAFGAEFHLGEMRRGEQERAHRVRRREVRHRQARRNRDARGDGGAGCVAEITQPG